MAHQKLTRTDHNHLSKAIEVARGSPMLMRHGCIVARGNKVISSGFNHYRGRFGDGWLGGRETCMVGSCSCHAEMTALRKIQCKLSRLREKE
jgi:tRNA(Arg) A34 adenosine deaminase TadA